MAKNQPALPKTSGFLAAYGGHIALAAVGIVCVAALIHDYRDMVRHNAANAPSAEGLNVGPQTEPPADKFDPAARNICAKSEETAVICKKLKAKYPTLTDDVITSFVRFSKFYGHQPSGPLALTLVEAKGNVIDGYSSQSTAFGPFHYLVDTFCEKLILDEDYLGTTRYAGNLAFIKQVKTHFPNNPGMIDAVVNMANTYLVNLGSDLEEIAKLNASIKPEGKTPAHFEAYKAKLDAATKPWRTQINTRRLELRDKLLKEYPNAVMAIQLVDILTRVSAEKLHSGHYYAQHVLGVGGAKYHLSLVAKETAAKVAYEKALAEKTPFTAVQKPITAVASHKMPKEINALHGTAHRGLIVPVSQTDIYPAFNKAFIKRAPGNVGIFFKIERVGEQKTVPATKTKPARTITVYHTVLVARTAAQVSEEIQRRFDEHHVNSRPINAIQHLGAGPTVPTIKFALNARPLTVVTR